VEYELPFVDELITPIIPDVATQMAALRTGKIDLYHETPIQYWSHLEEETPDVIANRFDRGNGGGLVFKADEPPFNARNVRRAMMIGTDLKACADLQDLGELPIYWWPLYSGLPDTIFTPMEDLPESSQILFDYNPELAKQMLADAGYPNGFKMQYFTDTQSANLDVAALLQDMYADIGVELEIKSMDTTTHYDYMYEKKFTHSIYTTIFGGATNPAGLNDTKSDGMFNFGKWSNPRYDALVNKASTLLDPAEQNPLWKEAGQIVLDDVRGIQLFSIPESVHWWPWLKNYYGEITADTDYFFSLAHAWFDEDMKKEMGY
jgi:peptide/nickel transport system substrate-binding protein